MQVSELVATLEEKLKTATHYPYKNLFIHFESMVTIKELQLLLNNQKNNDEQINKKNMKPFLNFLENHYDRINVGNDFISYKTKAYHVCTYLEFQLKLLGKVDYEYPLQQNKDYELSQSLLIKNIFHHQFELSAIFADCNELMRFMSITSPVYWHRFLEVVGFARLNKFFIINNVNFTGLLREFIEHEANVLPIFYVAVFMELQKLKAKVDSSEYFLANFMISNIAELNGNVEINIQCEMLKMIEIFLREEKLLKEPFKVYVDNYYQRNEGLRKKISRQLFEYLLNAEMIGVITKCIQQYEHNTKTKAKLIPVANSFGHRDDIIELLLEKSPIQWEGFLQQIDLTALNKLFLSDAKDFKTVVNSFTFSDCQNKDNAELFFAASVKYRNRLSAPEKNINSLQRVARFFNYGVVSTKSSELLALETLMKYLSGRGDYASLPACIQASYNYGQQKAFSFAEYQEAFKEGEIAAITNKFTEFNAAQCHGYKF